MRRASLHMLLCQFAMALGLLLSLGSEAWAARPAPQAAVDLEAPPALAEDASLDQLNAQLDLIRQRVTADASDDLLAELRQSALQVQRQADALLALRVADIERLDDQLKVIGPPQPDEAESLAAQRQALTRQKNALLDDERQATQLGQSSRDLAAQIVNLRRSLFNSQISSRAATPFSPSFWSTLIRPTDDDLRRLDKLKAEALVAFDSAIAPGHRWAFAGTLLATVLVWSFGRRLLERMLTWAMIRWLPEGRLRRSALALAVGLATILTIVGAVSLMRWGLESNASLSPDMASLTDQLVSLATFCAFIAGLGRALLMLPRPSWRLPAIPDRIASALGPFPAILAVALMLVATEERINSVTGTSLALTVALNGLTALVTALIFAAALLRYHHVRRKHDLERPGGIAGLIPFVASVWIAAILLALFTGYLSLAYFLTGKLLWISVIAATTYLLIAFFGDICETLLSPKHPSGLALANALGLSPRHQAQASTVLAGVGRTLLLLTALLLAFLPVGSSPSELLQGFAQLGESSKTLGNLNIVPQDILVALLLFVGGLFALRIVKRWLSERLLPETNMDAGMRASLVTLVGYLGFVLLAMLVMSTLRINLTSLTWVVSALSVGIGFGLQAIVQNFISGLILLTERPVKVGDWVSLGGVEGDIRRINVRATEIQMGDRSTVIVPNSQFISQTVRNVTMGNALGVVGVNLTLPLDTDAMKVRELLLQAFAEHPAILDAPAPSVTFKDLASNGLVLNASGFVNSPRSVAGARARPALHHPRPLAQRRHRAVLAAEPADDPGWRPGQRRACARDARLKRRGGLAVTQRVESAPFSTPNRHESRSPRYPPPAPARRAVPGAGGDPPSVPWSRPLLAGPGTIDRGLAAGRPAGDSVQEPQPEELQALRRTLGQLTTAPAWAASQGDTWSCSTATAQTAPANGCRASRWKPGTSWKTDCASASTWGATRTPGCSSTCAWAAAGCRSRPPAAACSTCSPTPAASRWRPLPAAPARWSTWTWPAARSTAAATITA